MQLFISFFVTDFVRKTHDFQNTLSNAKDFQNTLLFFVFDNATKISVMSFKARAKSTGYSLLRKQNNAKNERVKGQDQEVCLEVLGNKGPQSVLMCYLCHILGKCDQLHDKQV